MGGGGGVGAEGKGALMGAPKSSPPPPPQPLQRWPSPPSSVPRVPALCSNHGAAPAGAGGAAPACVRLSVRPPHHQLGWAQLMSS